MRVHGGSAAPDGEAPQPPVVRARGPERRTGLSLGRSQVPPSRRAGRAAHGGRGDRRAGQWRKGEKDVMMLRRQRLLFLPNGLEFSHRQPRLFLLSF